MMAGDFPFGIDIYKIRQRHDLERRRHRDSGQGGFGGIIKNIIGPERNFQFIILIISIKCRIDHHGKSAEIDFLRTQLVTHCKLSFGNTADRIFYGILFHTITPGIK